MKKLMKVIVSSMVVLGLMNGCGIINKDKTDSNTIQSSNGELETPQLTDDNQGNIIEDNTTQSSEGELETPPVVPEISDNNTGLKTPPSIPNLNKKQ